MATTKKIVKETVKDAVDAVKKSAKKEVECDACQGTGLKSTHELCDTCNGSGLV